MQPPPLPMARPRQAEIELSLSSPTTPLGINLHPRPARPLQYCPPTRHVALDFVSQNSSRPPEEASPVLPTASGIRFQVLLEL